MNEQKIPHLDSKRQLSPLGKCALGLVLIAKGAAHHANLKFLLESLSETAMQIKLTGPADIIKQGAEFPALHDLIRRAAAVETTEQNGVAELHLSFDLLQLLNEVQAHNI